MKLFETAMSQTFYQTKQLKSSEPIEKLALLLVLRFQAKS